MPISRFDIKDADIIDAVELKSIGATVIMTNVTVVSTTSSIKRVVLSGVHIQNVPEEEVEPDDIVVLTGTSGGLADGTYNVATIVDDTTFTVVEAIADSTGGKAEFRDPPGALHVGVDSTGFIWSSKANVQEVLEDLDASITGFDLTRLLFETNGAVVYTGDGIPTTKS